MLKKKELLDEVSQNLTMLKYYIEMQNNNSCFDINRCCEDFFCEFLNILWGANLINLNELKMNFPAVDLGDSDLGICIQITSNGALEKIRYTLTQFCEKKLHEDYTKIIILILGNKPKYKYKGSSSFEEFDFDFNKDIIDFNDLHKLISNMEMDKITKIRDFLKSNIKQVENKKYSYLSDIVIPKIKKGHYSAFIESLGLQMDSKEANITKADIEYIAGRLSEIDKTTREIMKTIIDKRQLFDGNRREYGSIFFNRDTLIKYLGIDESTMHKEFAILCQNDFLLVIEDSEKEFDKLYALSEGRDWDVLFGIVDFCYKKNRDISRLILQLDFSVLD